jgi:mannose-1-phosphate guanylyltransferase
MKDDMTQANNTYCVILAGGLGKRLWPSSRRDKPKQFLDFFGVGRTLLQQTYDRFLKVVPAENIYISTFVEYVAWVKEQLPMIDDERILAEPVQLSTAPAVAWATYHIASINPTANMIISPSDQQILYDDRFVEQVNKGLSFVEKTPNFLALAVKPTVPETGYGYIQVGEDINESGFGRVKSFTEKPDHEFARVFVESGEFFWNTGLFMWNVRTMLRSLTDFIPSIAVKLNSTGGMTREEELKFVQEYYPTNLYLSIDLVILERNSNVYVECCDFGWADMGSWSNLYDMSEKDDDENVVINSRVVMHDCRNNIVKLPKDKVAVLHGLDGYVLAEKNNVLLLCKNGDPSLVRRLVNEVQTQLGEDFL